MTRRRRILLAVIGAAVLALTGTGLALREGILLERLPPEIRERMPAHCRIPWRVPPAVRDGIGGLYAAKPFDRAEAARQLGDLGPEAAPAIPYLVAMLADHSIYKEPVDRHFHDSDSKEGTLVQYIRQGMDWLLPQGEDLEWPNWTPYGAAGDEAAYALADLGEAAVEPLVKALDDPLPQVRCRAAVALGILGDGRAADPLVRRLVDVDCRVGVAASWSRQELSAPSYEALLADLAEEHADAIPHYGLCDLRTPAQDKEVTLTPDDAIRLLEGDKADDWWKATSALRDRPDSRAIPLLMKGLDKWRGYYIQDALVAIGKEAVEPLLRAVNDPTFGHRSDAVTVLGRIGDLRGYDTILGFMQQDPDPGMRGCAAAALGGLHDSRAYEPLMAALATRDEAVASGAVDGLRHLGDRRAVPALLALWDEWAAEVDGEPGLRENAPFYVRFSSPAALLSLAEPRGIPAWAWTTDHPLGEASCPDDIKDVPALLMTPGAAGVEPLVQILRHERTGWWGVTQPWAAEALFRMDDPQGPAAFQKEYLRIPWNIRKIIWDDLANLEGKDQGRVLAGLATALKTDPSRWVRAEVIRVLMALAKDEALRPEVLRMLTQAAAGDRCRTVRLRAARAAEVLRRGEPYGFGYKDPQPFDDFIWDRMPEE